MRNTWVKAAGGIGAASALALSGAALSNAEGGNSASAAPTSSASSTPNGTPQARASDGGHRMHGTPVTGTTLTNVKNAVKAKDSAITVEKVFKENDGTYRALGTKSGARFMVEVSKELKTVTVKAGKPGGHGGPGGRGPGGADGHGRPGNAPGQESSDQASSSSSAGASGAAA